MCTLCKIFWSNLPLDSYFFWPFWKHQIGFNANFYLQFSLVWINFFSMPMTFIGVFLKFWIGYFQPLIFFMSSVWHLISLSRSLIPSRAYTLLSSLPLANSITISWWFLCYLFSSATIQILQEVDWFSICRIFCLVLTNFIYFIDFFLKTFPCLVVRMSVCHKYHSLESRQGMAGHKWHMTCDINLF